MKRVPKADVTERIERRRRDQQPGEQDHLALALTATPVSFFVLSCSMITINGV